jgi:CRISPR/Cas system CSM-associated protein Csm3 (group 7 of RAMP superfamily)
MRARGLRIANTIYNDPAKAKKFVSDIFGPDTIEKQIKRKKGDDPFASRLLVRERTVEGKSDMVQTRIRIDRFTGGTFPGALFEQQPVTGGSQSKITMSIELRNPKDPQIGLLLHILRDLWTGDLPLGGEASTGRGRLDGIKADLYLHQPQQEKPEEWHLSPKGAGQIQITGNREKLNAYAKNVGGAE